jgi:hypothetical protein
MRAPLYAASEFPNANPDLHAGRIDPELFPDIEDAFGDGDVEVVDDLPALASTEAEIELVGSEPETPRESMIRLVAAAAETQEEHADASEYDVEQFSSLEIPTLPPIDPALFEGVAESDVDGHVVEAEVEVQGQVAVDVAEPIEARSDDAFGRLIESIVRVSEVNVAVDVIIELFSGRPVPATLVGDCAGGLEGAGLVVRDDTQAIVLADGTKRAAKEWALIVRDEGGDFEACGGKTLDEFAAEIAAALTGDRSKFDTLRRSLRARGVAAYGLVCDAA